MSERTNELLTQLVALQSRQIAVQRQRWRISRSRWNDSGACSGARFHSSSG